MKHGVLLVDDEKHVLSSVKRVLRPLDHDIYTAESGAEALELLKQHEISIVVSDFRMPHMNGAELLSEIKKRYPDTIRIILSAYADLEAVTRAINEGSIYKFLFKPFDNSHLIQIVQEALEQYNLVKENQKLHADLEQANHELTVFNNELEKRVADKTKLVAKMAQYDDLTGLPNRFLLMDRLNQAIATAERNDSIVAVAFIDIDQFKKVNDSFGHATGDRLLQMVADRISPVIRKSDTLARIGGDEFTLMVTGLKSKRDIKPAVQTVMRAMSKPFLLENREIFLTASIGITAYPDDGVDEHNLLKNADAAMYHAKDEGRNNYQFYTNSMNEEAEERLAMESLLHQALDRNEFTLHYQPQYRIDNHKLTGFEALIRWQHPEQGLVSPDKFIPVLEETGLIVQVGEWVCKTACQQLKSWQDEQLPTVQMAVNISALQFNKPDFIEMIKRNILESGIDTRHGCFEVEMTESLLMNDTERVISTMTKLRQLGIEMSIDDFGTGYSSFNYLRSFPINTIKIDRSFIHEMNSSDDAQTIVNAIIVMAHAMNLTVIAEGVENDEQAQHLQAMGCDVIQGFLYGKPTTADQATEILRATQTKDKVSQDELAAESTVKTKGTG